jgi:hypothetical protein
VSEPLEPSASSCVTRPPAIINQTTANDGGKEARWLGALVEMSLPCLERRSEAARWRGVVVVVGSRSSGSDAWGAGSAWNAAIVKTRLWLWLSSPTGAGRGEPVRPRGL